MLHYNTLEAQQARNRAGVARFHLPQPAAPPIIARSFLLLVARTLPAERASARLVMTTLRREGHGPFM